MARQLTLLDPTNDWRLDERTREVGRKGIAQARAALAAAHAPAPERRPAAKPDRQRPAA